MFCSVLQIAAAPSGSAEPLPDFRSMSEDEAVELATGLGLVPEISPTPSSKSIGRVIDQSPAPGQEPIGMPGVLLSVSSGRILPDLRGLPIKNAASRLEALGIGWEAAHRPVPHLQENHISRQEPPPGSRIDPEQQVVFLTLSNADPTIPVLSGVLVSEAYEQLTSLGLQARHEPDAHWLPDSSISRLTARCGQQGQTRYIVEQTNPSAGATAPADTTVTLTWESRFDDWGVVWCNEEGVEH